MSKHVAGIESKVFCDPRTFTLLVALVEARFVLQKTDVNESKAGWVYNY